MHITSGFELTTALTNVVIFIVSIICFFKSEKKSIWRIFFLLICIDSFLGTIIHGIVMSEKIINILWIFLALLFTISVNTILCIFIRLKFKHVIILSILLAILLLTQMVLDINFIVTFELYIILVLLLCIYYSFKRDSKLLYLIGFFILLIGSIPVLSGCKISIIDHNGIAHLLLSVTLVFLYLGSKKDIKIEA